MCIASYYVLGDPKEGGSTWARFLVYHALTSVPRKTVRARVTFSYTTLLCSSLDNKFVRPMPSQLPRRVLPLLQDAVKHCLSPFLERVRERDYREYVQDQPLGEAPQGTRALRELDDTHNDQDVNTPTVRQGA